MPENKLGRREFLRLSAVAAAGGAIVACQPQTVIVEKEKIVKETVEVPKEVEKVVKETVEVAKEVTKVVKETVEVEKVVKETVEVEKVVTVAPEVVREPPMSHAEVEGGSLPPLDERLPGEPLVIEVVEEIGQYGGTWRRAFQGESDWGGLQRTNFGGLLRFDHLGQKIAGDIAQGWDVSADGTVWTFHLRKGLKWSDGEPMTADDGMFWWEDLVLNEEFSPVFPDWLQAGGENGTLEKLDDYTAAFTFPKPYAIFAGVAAHYIGNKSNFVLPKHYLKDFHPSYVSEEDLASKMDTLGYETWMDMFVGVGGGDSGMFRNPGYPTVRPWEVEKAWPAPRHVLVRNPYYCGVDPEGDQLPYIDRVAHEFVQTGEIINAKAAAGEIDMQSRHITLPNLPVLMENREKGDYRVLMWVSSVAAEPYITFNLDYKDPVLREIFRNVDFRIACSLAINREEINQLVFLGQGKARQATVLPQCPYYKEEFATAYAEYDPQQANELLDNIGLADKDAEGYRLRPDGQRLSIVWEFAEGVFGPWTDVAELVQGYWKDVGIDVAIQPKERGLWSTRASAGEIQMSSWSMDYMFTPLIRYDKFVPIGDTPGEISLSWYQWWTTGGAEGEEPTGDALQSFELYRQAVVTVDDNERIKIAQEIAALQAKNLWYIGTVGELPFPVPVKNYFHNVRDGVASDWIFYSPANDHPEQYFMKQA